MHDKAIIKPLQTTSPSKALKSSTKFFMSSFMDPFFHKLLAVSLGNYAKNNGKIRFGL